MKNISLLLTVVLISTLLSSCATIFNGTRQQVRINTLTPDAKIYVDGEFKANDAIALRLKRKDNHTITVKKEGYHTQNVNIDSKFQAGWLVFDLLLNWPALLLDAPTASWHKLEKTNVTVDLEKQ